jgi:hypothetical protein
LPLHEVQGGETEWDWEGKEEMIWEFMIRFDNLWYWVCGEGLEVKESRFLKALVC